MNKIGKFLILTYIENLSYLKINNLEKIYNFSSQHNYSKNNNDDLIYQYMFYRESNDGS